MSDESCETCRFWQKGDGYDGSCRRYPPAPDLVLLLGIIARKEQMPSDSVLDYFAYPVTIADDWCGEYQPKPS